jgi:hypothetical protein
MAEKHKNIILTVKQKLKSIEKFENGESVIQLAKDYGIGLQAVHDIKNNKMKLMEIVRDCNSGAGPSNHKSMKSLLAKR